MCLLNLLILLINGMISGCIPRHRDNWEHISVRYGFWKSLPKYDRSAFSEGYSRFNDVCKTNYFHGFLFEKEGNTQAMPIYDLNGELAGVRTTIPGNMHGYDSQNMSIDLPPVEIMPPVLKGHEDGILHYTVTAYFKHPSLLCSPLIPKGVHPGRGLYIQMGNNPEHHHSQIPLQSKHLSPVWKKGSCKPNMGTYYFMSLSPSLPCEKLYPLFLMYDIDGNLGGFGWVFQGSRPNNFYGEDSFGWFGLSPNIYPFLFNTTMLPPCMFYKPFQVFGVHIYLRDQNNLYCTRVGDIGNDGEQLQARNEGQKTVTSVNSLDKAPDTDGFEVTLEKTNVEQKESISAASFLDYSHLHVSFLAMFACWNTRWR